MVVTGARLGDVVGRRRAFLLGLAGFTVASLVGGLAPTSATLIAARALQGAAAGVMTPQVLSIIQLQFDGEARARAAGRLLHGPGCGRRRRPGAGGAGLSAHLFGAGWRPALLLNVPIGAALLLAVRRRLPDVPRRRHAAGWIPPARRDPRGRAPRTGDPADVRAPGRLAAVGLGLRRGRHARGGRVRRSGACDPARGGDPLFDLDVCTIPASPRGSAPSRSSWPATPGS